MGQLPDSLDVLNLRVKNKNALDEAGKQEL